MTGEAVDVARVLQLSDYAPTPDAPVQRVAGGHGDVLVIGEGGALAEDADAWLVLDGTFSGFGAFDAGAPAPRDVTVPSGARALVYRARVDAPPVEEPARARADPETVSGNAFVPLFETPRVAAALISIAGGRRMDAGPESERVFTVLRGNGLVFLQNDETLPFTAGDLLLVPAGEPARVWARGPGDVRLVAFQPQMPRAERRSLLGEIRERQRARDDPPGA